MEFFVDGSCLNNGHVPNKAGFGVIGFQGDKVVYTYYHSEDNSTNNRQELKAILYCLLHFGKEAEPVTVYSDSAYAINTFTSWMYNWQRNNWLKSNNKRPENLDLIQGYYNLEEKGYRLKLQKVRGHADNEKNNLADKLATGCITEKEILKLYG